MPDTKRLGQSGKKTARRGSLKKESRRAVFFRRAGRLDKSEKPHADASGLSGG
jgi:hypothetical protein